MKSEKTKDVKISLPYDVKFCLTFARRMRTLLQDFQERADKTLKKRALLRGTWKSRPVTPNLKRRLTRINRKKADLYHAFAMLKAKRFLL